MSVVQAGETPLHCAAAAGAPAEILAVLVEAERGATGRRDAEGRTPLLRLCMAGGCSKAAVRRACVGACDVLQGGGEEGLRGCV